MLQEYSSGGVSFFKTIENDHFFLLQNDCLNNIVYFKKIVLKPLKSINRFKSLKLPLIRFVNDCLIFMFYHSYSIFKKGQKKL